MAKVNYNTEETFENYVTDVAMWQKNVSVPEHMLYNIQCRNIEEGRCTFSDLILPSMVVMSIGSDITL